MSRFRFPLSGQSSYIVCLLTAVLSACSLTAVIGNTYRRPCLLFLKLAAPQQVNVQVYFKIEGSFQEKYSESKTTGSGDGLKSLYFTVPARHISALRIDPDADIRIVDMAIGKDVDLITMSSHGRSGLGRVFYGSVAAGVLHQIDRPILMIRSLGPN